MSRFTGKCDFYDAVEMYHLDEDKNSGMKVFHEGRLLGVDEYPLYYTHIVGSMGIEKIGEDTYRGVINLSSRDYNEELNEEFVGGVFSWMCHTVKSMKRKRKEASVEYLKEKCYSYSCGDFLDKIADAAVKCGGDEEKVDVTSLIVEEKLYSPIIVHCVAEYKKHLEDIGLGGRKGGIYGMD